MAPPQEPKAEQVNVNVAELRESKDAVIMRLMTLQSYIADLSKAYVEHVNQVIGGGPATIEFPALPQGMSLGHFHRADSPAAKSEAGGVKKRKRAPPDPNAPKRPLTPYFLYMQHNRATIAQEMGPEAKKKDVSDEGTRRWQQMNETDKNIWKSHYNENYEKYKADVAAYKATGRKVDEEDPAATQLQKDFAGAETKESDESSSEDEDEESESSPSPPSPPPKQKTPRSNKRHRSDAKKEVPDSAVKQSSPVKKGRGKKAEAPKETPATETKTKGKGGKKRKSEA